MKETKGKDQRIFLKDVRLKAFILGVFIFSFPGHYVFQNAYAQLESASSSKGTGSIGRTIGGSLFGGIGATVGEATERAVGVAAETAKTAASGVTSGVKGFAVPNLIDSNPNRDSNVNSSVANGAAWQNNSEQIPANAKVVSLGNGGKIQVEIEGREVTLHIHNKEVTGLPPGWEGNVLTEESKVVIFPIASESDSRIARNANEILESLTADGDKTKIKAETSIANLEKEVDAQPEAAGSVETPLEKAAKSAQGEVVLGERVKPGIEGVSGNIKRLAKRGDSTTDSGESSGMDDLLKPQDKIAAVGGQLKPAIARKTPGDIATLAQRLDAPTGSLRTSGSDVLLKPQDNLLLQASGDIERLAQRAADSSTHGLSRGVEALLKPQSELAAAGERVKPAIAGKVPGDIEGLTQRVAAPSTDLRMQRPNVLTKFLEPQITAAMLAEFNSHFYSFAETPQINVRIKPDISTEIKPALVKLGNLESGLSRMPKPFLERLAEIRSRMPAEVNPTFAKLSQLNLSSANSLTTSPFAQLVQAEVSPVINPTAAFAKLDKISEKISNVSQGAMGEGSLRNTVSLEKFAVRLQLNQKPLEVKPGLANLGQSSALTSLSVIKIELPSLVLKGMDLASIAEMGEVKALPIPQLNSLLRESRTSFSLKPLPLKGLDLTSIAKLQKINALPIPHLEGLLRESRLKAPDLSRQITPLTKSFFPKPSDLNIKLRLLESVRPKTAKKLSTAGFIRLVHGDNGQRKQAVGVLELSGIDVANLLMVSQVTELQPISYLSLEAKFIDKKVEKMMAAFLLEKDLVKRQLLLRVVK